MPQSMGDVLLGFAATVQGSSNELLSYLLKITALEAYERAALLNESRNAAPVVGIWDWDVPNNIRHFDPVCAAHFGYAREQRNFFSEEITQRIHPDDIEGWIKKVDFVAKNGGIYENKYRVIRDGKIRWLYAKGQCVLDKSGRPERFPGATIDVTDRKDFVLSEAAA